MQAINGDNPCVVTLHPFKTQKGRKAGIPDRREGVEAFTRRHSRQSSVHVLRAGGVPLATESPQIPVSFCPALLSLHPTGGNRGEEP